MGEMGLAADTQRDPIRPGAWSGRPPSASDLYKAVGLLLLLLVVYAYLEQITHTLLLVYAAAILGVAFNALVGRAPTHRRGLSALLGILLVGGLIAGVWFGVPALASQVRGFSNDLPQLYEQLDSWTNRLQAETGLNIDLFSENSREFVSGLFSGDQVIGTARGVMEGLFIPLVLMIGGLFAAAKPNEMMRPMLRAVPAERRDDFARLFTLLGERLIAWVKGTLVSFSIVFVLASVGLWLLGVPYPLVLGLLSGMSEFVPIIGAIVTGLIVVGVAFLNNPEVALWVALLMLAIQQVDANLLMPMVMSKVAEVHPFVTLFAILLFGAMFGFMGVLLAVPLVLLIWTVVQVLWVERSIETEHDWIPPIADD